MNASQWLYRDKKIPESIKALPGNIDKGLIIIGTGPSLREYDNSAGADVWGLNGMYQIAEAYGARPTAWFEIHDIRKGPKGVWLRRGETTHGQFTINEHLKNLNLLECPVIMHTKNEVVKSSIAYPWVEVLDAYEYQNFTCTISWQVALAILMGYKRIALYGIDMTGDRWERQYQKASVEYWIGFAQGLGIKTHVPLTSSLLKAPALYAFDKRNFYTDETWGKDHGRT